jgi:hypothetical protein
VPGGFVYATTVRLRILYGGGEVMCNCDLALSNGHPKAMLEGDPRCFGHHFAVALPLDPQYLHKKDWPDAEYFYELPVIDPRSDPAFASFIGYEPIMERTERIPDDLRRAFCDAIHVYADWKLGGSERPISFRRIQKISISGVCELLLSYRTEPLPDNIQNQLLSVVDVISISSNVRLTFATAAQYLLKLIFDQRKQENGLTRSRRS